MATLQDYKSKYLIEDLSFPSDLHGSPEKYGNSWVMININVIGNTKYLRGDTYMETVSLDSDELRDFSNTRQAGAAGVVGATATIAAATAAGSVGLSNLLGKKSSAVEKGIAAGKGIAVGAVAASPLALAGTTTRETKRLKTAIALPMPNQLNTSYGANWGDDDTSVFSAAMRLGQSAANGAEGLAAIALKGQNALGSGAISAASGLAYNPKKEMIFNGVNFRKFTMDYRFYPKDELERARVLRICSELKFHMHPEYKSDARFTFLYPSEFDISFYHESTENIWVNKIATCVLESMSLNYTPDGLWAQHRGGSPNAIQLTLNFQELSILTKEAILKGF